MTSREYLDFNVFVSVMRNRHPGLREFLDARKGAGTIFPYSPAHIEETAVVFREQQDPEEARRLVAEHLRLIEEISGGWELLPALSGPTRFEPEPPAVCMGRVIDGYQLTWSAEESERFQMSFKSAEAFDQVQEEFGTALRAQPGVPLFEERRAQYGVEVQTINNLSETALFADPRVLEGLRQKLWHHGWNPDTLPKGDELLRSHQTREAVVALVMNFLEEIGYRADKFDKYRSHLHDVSHAIYAAATDIFVSGDERYRKRVRSAYHFLGIATRVIGIEEFMTGAPET